MAEAWSWILTAVGVTGLWLAGRRKWYGWAVGLGAQALWISYGIVSNQLGFVASAIVYGAVYANNLRRWRRG